MSGIDLIGISGERLPPETRPLVAAATVVVASRRHRFLVADMGKACIPMTPVTAMERQVAHGLERGSVAVLASGDPLFFGIGRRLLARFGPDRVTIHPALSALQLACARFKVPWDDLAWVSLHGREPLNLAGKILRAPRVMLLTDPRQPPDRIAEKLLAALEQLGARDLAGRIRMQVAENLGLPDERLCSGTLDEIAAATFGPLHMVLVHTPLEKRPSPLGLREEEISHVRGLITKDEIRAAVLHFLRLPPAGVFWDVGGGSGSIAIEAARLCPELDIFCVEQKEAHLEHIRRNIRAHQTFGVQPVAGRAPEVLAGLPDPDRVFVGGSGGNLAGIIRQAASRLPTAGRLVVTAVIEQTVDLAPALMAAQGLVVSGSRIQVTRLGEAGARRLNPITIICGKR